MYHHNQVGLRKEGKCIAWSIVIYLHVCNEKQDTSRSRYHSRSCERCIVEFRVSLISPVVSETTSQNCNNKHIVPPFKDKRYSCVDCDKVSYDTDKRLSEILHYARSGIKMNGLLLKKLKHIFKEQHGTGIQGVIPHLMLHLVDNMLEYGPTSGFNTERWDNYAVTVCQIKLVHWGCNRSLWWMLMSVCPACVSVNLNAVNCFRLGNEFCWYISLVDLKLLIPWFVRRTFTLIGLHPAEILPWSLRSLVHSELCAVVEQWKED